MIESIVVVVNVSCELNWLKKVNLNNLFLLIALFISINSCFSQKVSLIYEIDEPKGFLTPKSITHNGEGIFAAQNMMYNHSISFYDRSFNLLHVLNDQVNLSEYGYCSYDNWLQGAPVEAVFDSSGRFLYVSNYKLYGPGFAQEAYDNCEIGESNESGYVYKIDLKDYSIVDVYMVGVVPKYLILIEEFGYLAVSNWCSGTVSIIDLNTGQEKAEVFVGKYPRGLANHSNKLFVSVMGADRLAVIDLKSLKTMGEIITGSGPRDVHVEETLNQLMVSLNNSGQVALYSLSQETMKRIDVGNQPRSMAYDSERQLLFVVLYGEQSFAIIDVSEQQLVEKIPSCRKPIGIEYDEQEQELWVACYDGRIAVYSVKSISNETKKPEEQGIKKQEYDTSRKYRKKYFLVCGSFKKKENAQERIKVLKIAGFKPYMSQENNQFRVIVLQGEDKGGLESVARKIKMDFDLDSWIGTFDSNHRTP